MAEATQPSSSPPQTGGGAVVEYLSRTGALYAERRELLRRRQAGRERAAAPFRPAITPYAEAAARRSIQRRAESIEERLHHLHQRRLEREAAERERQQAAAAAEVAALPFAPRITHRAAELADRGDVAETSRQWQRERQERLWALQAARAREELAETRSRPRITAFALATGAAGRPAGMPIGDHLMVHEQRRQRRQFALAELQWACPPPEGPDAGATTAAASPSSFLQQQQSPSWSAILNTSAGASSLHHQQRHSTPPRKWFEPVISAHAAGLRRPGAVSERLYRDALDRSHGEEERERTEAGDEARQATQPELSAYSRQLSRSYYADPAVRARPAHDRLHLNPRVPSKYRGGKDAGGSGGGDGTGDSHRPRINETSRLLAEAARERERAAASGRGGGGLADSPSSRLHRSARPAAALPSDSNDGDPTFHPRVSPQSEALWARQLEMLRRDGHARTAEEARLLLWRRAQKRREDDLGRRLALKAAAEMMECTFHPKAGRAPVGRPGYDTARALSVAERSGLWARQRDQRLERLRAERAAELAEAAGCTFAPAVNETFPLPRATERDLPGEAVFLQRQDEARQRRAEAETWWQPKDGAGGGSAVGRSRGTSVESFHLESERQQQQHRARSPSVASRRSHGPAYDEDEEDDYIFQPHYPASRSPEGWADPRGEEGGGGGADYDSALHHNRPQPPRQPTPPHHLRGSQQSDRPSSAPPRDVYGYYR